MGGDDPDSPYGAEVAAGFASVDAITSLYDAPDGPVKWPWRRREGYLEAGLGPGAV